MKKSVVRFPSPSVLRTCLFALSCLTFSSVGYASPQPSEADNVHFCLPIDFEELSARDSSYAARKQAFDLNVGEPRTVRLIYFLPNDRPFRAEVVDSMKVAIRRIQTFYGDQMQVHGYGNKTFRFETDAHGEPMVHRVDGQNVGSAVFSLETWMDTGKSAKSFAIHTAREFLMRSFFNGLLFARPKAVSPFEKITSSSSFS